MSELDADKQIVPPRVSVKNTLVRSKQKLDGLKVGQKIALGYAIALGIAILGTGIGGLIGHYYENQAETQREDALKAISLPAKIQFNLLLAQVYQYRLVSVLLYPERLEYQYNQFHKHIIQANAAWDALKASHDSRAKSEEWEELLEYDRLLEQYLNEVESIFERFDLLNLSSENIEAARERLLIFNSGVLGIKLVEFSETLNTLLDTTSQDYAAAEAAFQRARMLRYQLLILSATISITIAIALAWYTTGAIANPVKDLTSIAQTVTQNSNFALQAAITTDDEVGQLALSLNHLIERVRLLLAEKEQQALELETAKEAADIANRAKSEFLANMSHELRTPLNGILGYAQILQRSDISPKQKHGADIIEQCGSHLLTLINDVLDLAKIEARKLELYPQPFHLLNFLRGVTEICRLKADQKNISFSFQPAPTLPAVVYGDANRLRQVLLNLLNNAIKFTDTGGVVFTVEPIDKPPNEKLFINRIRFSVEDTGAGIAPEQLNQIFLPFEQVGRHKNSEGTGLGLAITRQIVELMGSHIQVESILGRGSVFTVDLEFPRLAHEPLVREASGTIINIRGTAKILIIDERPENRSVIVNLLELFGFEVTEANNGQEGLDKAAAFNPDLIIVDLLMPVMDGFTFLKQLRASAQLQHIPAIVSSASVYEIDRQTSLKAGGDDFLPKPVRLEELLKMLEQHLQIEWIYDDAPASPESTDVPTQLVIPPFTEINKLHQLVMSGNLKELTKQARQLKLNDYTDFAEILQQMAQEFKVKELKEFINQHRSEQ